MPVIGGNTPTVQVSVPVPTPAPMKKPRPQPKPKPAAQPVPANPESPQQDVPQGMGPPVPQQPEPRAIILPWAPPPSKPKQVMRKMRVRKYGRGDDIAAMVQSVRENPTDSTPRNMLADYLSENHEPHYTPKEIQALRTTPHLKIEHIPANPNRPVHIAKLTMADIRDANQNSGGNWFSRSNQRFFGTKIHGAPKHGPGGVYFVTSEQPPSFNGARSRSFFSVRRFNPETGDIRTMGTLGQHQDVTSASSEAIGRANNHPRFQEQPEQLSRPKRYAAGDDGMSMDFDSMGEDELPKQSLQRPAPKEDITGRKRRQTLLQMLEAAKKGLYRPDGMTPREINTEAEQPPDVPQFGGDVWMSDPEDEEPQKMARSSPESLNKLFEAAQGNSDQNIHAALADELTDHGRHDEAELLRSGQGRFTVDEPSVMPDGRVGRQKRGVRVVPIPKHSTLNFWNAVKRAKSEVLSDIRRGHVPADVPDFSSLHDHVDANYYGGAFEQGSLEDVPEGEDVPDDYWDFWNGVQDEVDQWLRRGRK